MDMLVNKVAESGIITLNLEDYIAKNVMIFDLKPFLFMELILKEKDYRAALLAHDWSVYEGKDIVLTCSADAIVPVWAYMLATTYLEPLAHYLVMSTEAEGRTLLMLQYIAALDTSLYEDKRVVIKGCGEIPIPESAYVAITFKLRPHVKSLMYGEPCSTVPLYKKKKI